MLEILSSWQIVILFSALALGVYDLSKKHAVNGNAVMPVLFWATFSGSLCFVLTMFLTHDAAEYMNCSLNIWLLLLLKAALVGSCWSFVYYAMRDLPISIVAPIRATAPLWTFLGSLVIFSEIPTWLQGLGMLSIFIGYYLFSVLGKLEGFSLRHRSMIFIIIGTLLGAISSLYDKYLLSSLSIPRLVVQFWFCVNITVLLGIAQLFIKSSRKFTWRWSIPTTGILLIIADFLYFGALSQEGVQISILSLMRRSSCVVAFLLGCWLFKDANVRQKGIALLLIILGVTLLALF